MAGVAAIGARPRFMPRYAKLNYSHPLSNGLIFCGIPALGTDLVDNRNCTTFNADRSPSMFGFTSRVAWPNAQTADTAILSGAHTIGIAASFLGTPSSTIAAFDRSNYSSEASNAGWALNYINTSRIRYNVFNNNGAANYALDTTAMSNHGTVVGTSDGSTRRSIYIDGLRSNTTTSGNFVPNNSTDNLAMNAGGGTAVTVACIWGRQLSDNEIAMFAADPFCMLSY